MNAETIRRLENTIRLGRIKTVTPSSPFHTVTVNLGDIVTKELRLLNLRAGTDSTHDLPTKGEECIVLSPCGVIELGIVVVGLNNEDFPTPSQDPNIKLRVFEDGAVISYDTKNHSLQAILPANATAILTASGGLTINGDTTINGNLITNGDSTTNGNVQTNGSTAMTGNNTVGGSQLVQGSSHSSGDFSTEGDVKAGEISLNLHKHPGDSGGTTGGPIP
ncbi:phage baseplate assembly protein V [Acinetobacter baumannii]|uniref:phage baseplate assembly protein V n=1 Tax=Acinetobacter calcoaceticus/baumannii complex TaxID=909768 RepID=UPI0028709BDF|nr:phage baseplate assembly protein V [Acinetobacter baumannii]MDR9529970.1 phage baseplate assembly protein V [Acinetobacter baumannii]MDU6100984.1 phage baseplate assembly protein V [Acinetobacter sp.]MDU6284974.1 phage baseplate assembly protein V [Acinetobacter sp.]